METLEKVGILLEVRKSEAASSELTELWKKRRAMIKANPLSQSTWTDFPKYPSSKDESVKVFCAKANGQLAIYRGNKGMFAREWIFEAAEKQPAYEWWDSNGASVPELQTVARLVLAQPSSSSICEYS